MYFILSVCLNFSLPFCNQTVFKYSFTVCLRLNRQKKNLLTTTMNINENTYPLEITAGLKPTICCNYHFIRLIRTEQRTRFEQ